MRIRLGQEVSADYNGIITAMKYAAFLFVATAIYAAEHGPAASDLIAKNEVQNIEVVNGKAKVKVFDAATTVTDARQELLSQAERYHAGPNWKPVPGIEELRKLYLTYGELFDLKDDDVLIQIPSRVAPLSSPNAYKGLTVYSGPGHPTKMQISGFRYRLDTRPPLPFFCAPGCNEGRGYQYWVRWGDIKNRSIIDDTPDSVAAQQRKRDEAMRAAGRGY